MISGERIGVAATSQRVHSEAKSLLTCGVFCFCRAVRNLSPSGQLKHSDKLDGGLPDVGPWIGGLGGLEWPAPRNLTPSTPFLSSGGSQGVRTPGLEGQRWTTGVALDELYPAGGSEARKAEALQRAALPFMDGSERLLSGVTPCVTPLPLSFVQAHR